MGGKRLTGSAAAFAASILICAGCGNGHSNQGRTAAAKDVDELPLPAGPPGWSILATASGDLDSDDIADLAVVWSAPASDPGSARLLNLYRAGRRSWELFHQSTGPVMGSTENGLSGDPFRSLGILDRCVVIRQSGDNHEHWDYEHRFGLRGNVWLLTGAVAAYGELCDTFTTLDYNLMTGAAELNRESNNCDETGTEVPGKGDANLQQFSRPVVPVPMDGFRPGTNPIDAPDGTKAYY